MKILEDKIIKINGEDCKVKMSIRAMLTYETLSGHTIDSVSTLNDAVMLFYATYKAGGNNKTYDEFLDLVDDDLDALKAFSEWSLVGTVEKK